MLSSVDQAQSNKNENRIKMSFNYKKLNIDIKEILIYV